MKTLAHAQHDARGRPRRPAWVLVCLWLLVALMPLRAWAAAEMTATPVTAWAASEAVSGLPPCHAAAEADAGSDAPAHGGTCEQCLFCAPLIAAPDITPAAPAPQGDVLHAAAPGTAPPGALDPLFRPPRG